jgi:hypothetical protein
MKVGASGADRSIKVYRVDPGLRIVFYGLAGLFVLAGVALTALHLRGVDIDGPGRHAGPVAKAALLAAFYGMGVLTAYVASRTRLVLSPQGLEYRSLGYSIACDWGNVESIGRARYRRSESVDSLLLREPALRRHGPFGLLVWLYARSDAIPLEQFGSSRHGPLSRDLKRYAPHLYPGAGAAGEARHPDGT